MDLIKHIDFTVERPISDTMDNFTDLQKYVKLHPLLIKTDLIAVNKYRLCEKPFTWLPFTFTYYAHLVQDAHKLTYLITGIPFTKTRFDYEFSEIEFNKTKINLSIQINGFTVITPTLMKLMVNAQRTVSSNLNRQ